MQKYFNKNLKIIYKYLKINKKNLNKNADGF